MASLTAVILGSDEETRQKLTASVSDRLRNLGLLGGENPASVVTRETALILKNRVLAGTSSRREWVGHGSSTPRLLLVGAGKRLTSADFSGYEVAKAQRVYLPATESEPDCVVSCEGVVCSGRHHPGKQSASVN